MSPTAQISTRTTSGDMEAVTGELAQEQRCKSNSLLASAHTKARDTVCAALYGGLIFLRIRCTIEAVIGKHPFSGKVRTALL
jgi:hypothetical protein